MRDSGIIHKKYQAKRYSALASAFLATAAAAEAGIVYTDLDPDETAMNSDVLIDMDGDGVYEFKAEQSGYNTGGSTFFFSNQITRLRGNAGAGFPYGWVNNGATFLVGALASGATIDAASPITTSTWGTVGAYRIFSSAFYFSSSSRGDWRSAENLFIGVTFDLPDGTHYGWIRASVSDTYDAFVIHDFAYEDVPGAAIIAGDTGGCSTDVPPQNPASSLGASDVTLSWDAVNGSVACQIRANRISPVGPSPSANIFGSEISSFDVPNAVLGSGTTWSWQVRCACEISPVDATGLSVADTFSVPVLRQQQPLIDADLFPNPAMTRTRLALDQAAARELEVRVVDILGRQVDFILLPAHAQQLDLDLTHLEAGVYMVMVGDLKPLTLEVAR